MNKYIRNLRELFDEDDKVVYHALIEKKDWILDSFYVLCSLDNNADIEDLIDGNLRFKQLMIDPYLLKQNKEETISATKKFNESFRVLYLNEEKVPFDGNTSFVMRLNFKRLNDTDYKNLFANFFPCVESNELIRDKAEDSLDLLELAMDKNLGDNVIILDNQYLKDGKYHARIVDKIYVLSSMPYQYKMNLSLLSKKLGIEFIEEYDN